MEHLRPQLYYTSTGSRGLASVDVHELSSLGASGRARCRRLFSVVIPKSAAENLLSCCYPVSDRLLCNIHVRLLAEQVLSFPLLPRSLFEFSKRAESISLVKAYGATSRLQCPVRAICLLLWAWFLNNGGLSSDVNGFTTNCGFHDAIVQGLML